MGIDVVVGDLLAQEVDAIVNPWNRNIIPWWLLLPQGVSGAIKKRGGVAPFREVARHGPMPLGTAVRTGPGRLPFRGIIHVAGIDMLWRASERSIRDGSLAALRVAEAHGDRSVAFPLIGAGSGSFDPPSCLRIMMEALAPHADGEVRIVVVWWEGLGTCPIEPSASA